MPKYKLPDYLLERYSELKVKIQSRLLEFQKIPADLYFYELCFCICTPQSQAKNAFQVQKKLMALDFLNNPFIPENILFNKKHYIRFHSQKATRIFEIAGKFENVMKIIASDLIPEEKRLWLADNVKGIGMKESAHFLRNIGYRNLAILDRHVLKHLTQCGLFDELPKIKNRKHYLKIESEFLIFSKQVNIPMDELDLLFWSYETGEILK